ncbi:MAG TPA: PP2C family protein-serine/threonine phosphatase [Candidatus Acidoferrum sp.]|nr:PP2C family protein-serine/threonine phosphatase [Candidatus Acidoferrum sp.]
MSASASPTPGVSSTAPPVGHRSRIRNFWQRVSEGRQLDELWSQFTADARASYSFYMKEADAEELGSRRGIGRFFHICKTLFWSMLMKMTPARRVLLLIALILLLMSGFTFQFGHNVEVQFKFELFAALLFLLLLSLELADKVTMKRDLEIAREIQTWLVPSAAPEVPGADIAFATRPQNSVAGDYYDAFYPDPERRDRLLLVIADVAGKSVPAALLMATLQASLRTIAGEGVPVVELVTRLNRYASAYSLDGRRFTTAVLCEYDPASGRVTYVNAGHNAPILRRADGTLETLATGGLPLGIEIGAQYETATLVLRQGDALILFTDGVVEAFNQTGQEFGNERWLGAIRNLPDWNAQETLQFLMKRVDEFVGATRQSDDITCLVFRSK